MRRSSPVQQWLDSLPAEVSTEDKPANDQDHIISNEEDSKLEPDSEDEANTDTEKIQKDTMPEDKTLEVPNTRELWKRKSLESGVLTSTPLHDKTKKLQRDYSVQSDGPAVTLKNPLFRDSSLQVGFFIFLYFLFLFQLTIK